MLGITGIKDKIKDRKNDDVSPIGLHRRFLSGIRKDMITLVR